MSTPTQAQIEAEHAVGFREGVEWAKQHLIERCAQVAETFPAGMDRVKEVIARSIAAEIRKLKDAPTWRWRNKRRLKNE